LYRYNLGGGALQPGEARIHKSEVDTLHKRLKSLEQSSSQKDLANRDKDELIRALYSRLELAKQNREVDGSDASDENADLSSRGGSGDRLGAAEALQTARARQAELHGANTALRGRCQELDGEVQAARTESAALRRRLETLEGDKMPEMTELVGAALAQERSSFEAQSLKALRVLEAKDAVLQAREREVAEARAESGALSTTLAAARRELDACEARLIAVLDEQSHLREDVEKTRTDASRTEAQLRGEITRLTADLERANAKGANADAATRKATRLEEECAFLRAEASTASEAVAAAREEAADLKAALHNAAELRAAEREQLAARVAAAEGERRAIAASAKEDGARLTADLARAHHSLAAALDSAAGDRLLTGAAAAAEAAHTSATAAATAATRQSFAQSAIAATPGSHAHYDDAMTTGTTTHTDHYAGGARGTHASRPPLPRTTDRPTVTATQGTQANVAAVPYTYTSTAATATSTSLPATATAGTSTSPPQTNTASTSPPYTVPGSGAHTQTPGVAVASAIDVTTAAASPMQIAAAAASSIPTAAAYLAQAAAAMGALSVGGGGVDGASQTPPPPLARYEPTTPATNTTPAAVVSSGPEKVAREIVRLQRERDEAVAAAARAAQAASEAQRVADDARGIIAAAAARAAAAADLAVAVADAVTAPPPMAAPAGPANVHFHMQQQQQQHREREWDAYQGYASHYPGLDAGRHAAEVASLELQVKELQSALRLRDGEARRAHVQMSADHAAESEALRTELAALRDRLRYAASNPAKSPALGLASPPRFEGNS
jgi:hypothetical protein